MIRGGNTPLIYSKGGKGYMFFENSNGKSPVQFQDFIYVGEYFNGQVFSEFDFNTKEKNNFYSIDRSLLYKFGLIGQGMKLYFDTTNGLFYLNGHKVYFSYKTKDKEYMLSNSNVQGVYNDIITYKDAYTDAEMNIYDPNKRNTSRIHQYNFGFKKQLSFEDRTVLNFQAIVCIPYDKPAFIQLKIVSNKDLDGEIYVKRVGAITQSINAPLSKEYAGVCEWIIN